METLTLQSAMTKRLTPVVVLALSLTVAGSLVAFSLLAQDFAPGIGAGQNLFPQGVQAGVGETITLASPTPIDNIIGADAQIATATPVSTGQLQNDLDTKLSVATAERAEGTATPKLGRKDSAKPDGSGRKGKKDESARPSKKSSRGKAGASGKPSKRSSVAGTSTKGSRHQAAASSSSKSSGSAGHSRSRGHMSSAAHRGSRGHMSSAARRGSRGHKSSDAHGG